MQIGGTEVYTHTLAGLQKANGHQVFVLTPHFEVDVPGQYKDHYTYEGIEVYQYMETSNSNDRDIVFGKKDPEGLKDFGERLKLLQPDIVHFHELIRSTGLGVKHVKLAKEFGAKVFLTMHLTFYTCNTNILVNNNKLCHGKILNFDCSVCSFSSMYNLPKAIALSVVKSGIWLDKIGLLSKVPTNKAKTLFSMHESIERIKKDLVELTNNVDQMIVLGDWYKKILLDNGVPESKVTVIKQALATNKIGIQNVKKEDNLPLKIVFLGRIEPQKGVHLLIGAVKNFSLKEIRLDIYGKPENTSYYKECVAIINKGYRKYNVRFTELFESNTNYNILFR